MYEPGVIAAFFEVIMNATEFFEAVEEAAKNTKSSNPAGCDYFISDMEKLFEEWESEEHDYSW